MATNYQMRVNAPTSNGTVSVATAAGTAGLWAFNGAVRVWIKSPVDTQFRFGDSAVSAPATAALYFSAGQDYVLDVPSGVTNGRVKLLTPADGASTLYWAQVA